MQLASQGINGHLMQILDPAEATMPFRGRTRFEGLENESPQRFQTVAKILAPNKRITNCCAYAGRMVVTGRKSKTARTASGSSPVTARWTG